MPVIIKTYTEARQNLAELMDQANASNVPIVVTRQRAKPVVMISFDEYSSIAETLHLLRSPKNAKSLRTAIAELDAGKGATHDLIEPGSRPRSRLKRAAAAKNAPRRSSIKVAR